MHYPYGGSRFSYFCYGAISTFYVLDLVKKKKTTFILIIDLFCGKRKIWIVSQRSMQWQNLEKHPSYIPNLITSFSADILFTHKVYINPHTMITAPKHPRFHAADANVLYKLENSSISSSLWWIEPPQDTQYDLQTPTKKESYSLVFQLGKDQRK